MEKMADENLAKKHNSAKKRLTEGMGMHCDGWERKEGLLEIIFTFGLCPFAFDVTSTPSHMHANQTYQATSIPSTIYWYIFFRSSPLPCRSSSFTLLPKSSSSGVFLESR